MATSSSPADSSSKAAVEVAVIGSARIADTDPRYPEAVRLGAALADAGWTVVTGGYGGLMGATAIGAASRGGHTVGLPMAPWEHLIPHPSSAELRWSNDYAERMRHLLRASAVVALPGGIGTLAEASSVWAAAQTEPGSTLLVVVGPNWQHLLKAFDRELVIDATDLQLVHSVTSVDQVVPVIRQLLLQPDQHMTSRG